MVHIESGHYGAKVQSTKKANPRAIVIQVLTENPQWNMNIVEHRDACFREVDRRLLASEDYEELVAVIREAWHANEFRNLIRVVNKSPQEERANQDKRQGEIQARVAAATEKVQQVIHAKAQLLLLEMIMPNGKQLGDCTGAECKAMAPKVGKMLTRLGKTVKSKQLVSEVYKSNASLRKIYR